MILILRKLCKIVSAIDLKNPFGTVFETFKNIKQNDMKKLFVTLLLITAVAAGSMFAQTATTSSTPTAENKVVMKNGSTAKIRKNAASKNHEKVAQHRKANHKKPAAAGDQTKKDKIRANKDQIIEKAGGKAEAKQMLKKKQMQHKQDKKDE